MSMSKFIRVSFPAAIVAIGIFAAFSPAATITDDFSDANHTANPAWTVVSGSFDASAQELQFGTASGTRIRLDTAAAAGAATLTLDLRKSTNTQANYLFQVQLIDTDTGNYTILQASPNPGYFGSTGMRLQHWDGPENLYEQVFGPAGLELLDDTDYHTISLSFDPGTGTSVTYDSQSFSVGNAPAFALNKVDRIELIGGGGGDINWYVDNVSFTAVPEPASTAALAAAGLLLSSRRRRGA